MKAIMMSIKPKYVADILNGHKTIEIRKTCPEVFKHLKPYEGCSIDVYIYCTKDKGNNLHKNRNGWFANEMNVIFVEGKPIYENYNGKVVAKFTLLNRVEEIKAIPYPNNPYPNDNYPHDNYPKHIYWYNYITETKSQGILLGEAQVDYYDINQVYLKGKNGYAWYINNLEIFDKPKELSEFNSFQRAKATDCGFLKQCKNCGRKFNRCHLLKPLTKAPQSWCYIEVEGE